MTDNEKILERLDAIDKKLFHQRAEQVEMIIKLNRIFPSIFGEELENSRE